MKMLHCFNVNKCLIIHCQCIREMKKFMKALICLVIFCQYV